MHGSQVDLENFRQYRNLTKVQIKNLFKAYISNIEENMLHEPGALWEFIRNKNRQSRIPGNMQYGNTTLNTPAEIVNAFADYFSSVYRPPSNPTNDSWNDNSFDVDVLPFGKSDVINAIRNLKRCKSIGEDGIPLSILSDCAYFLADPLLSIFNKSVTSSVFPDAWKSARIVPIHKVGNKHNITNYRPIAILSVFSKVFEKLLHETIIHQINQQISFNQHGFMKKRSTSTNLVQITQQIANTLDEKGQMDIIYTDFQKAFDTIDTEIIIKKMHSLGFRQTLVEFFRSYLTGRQHQVFYNGTSSKVFVPTSGVPQGSIMGPLMFLIFINDLPEQLQCNVLMFADDLKLSKRITDLRDCIHLQECLHQLSTWCTLNKLQLNVGKCKSITFTNKHHAIDFSYKINNINLEKVNNISDLGILFDSQLNFGSHITDITTRASQRAGFIWRNCREFSNIAVLRSLYMQFVRPILEYGSVIWSPACKLRIDQLEKVQRRYLRGLHYKTTGSYPPIGYRHELLLEEFDLCSLQSRRKYMDTLFIVNIANNRIDAPDILSQLNFRVPRLGSRNSDMFYLDQSHKCVKSNSPIHRMCQLVNRYSPQIDIFNCKKNTIQDICLQHSH